MSIFLYRWIASLIFGLLGQYPVIQLELFLAFINQVAEEKNNSLLMVDHFRRDKRNGSGFFKQPERVVNIEMIFLGNIGNERGVRLVHKERAEQDGTQEFILQIRGYTMV